MRVLLFWIWIAARTPRGKLLKESLLRNLNILGKLGCLDAVGVAKLRPRNAPTITKGPYVGELATVHHRVSADHKKSNL